jgi:hypothetical protein
MGKLQPGEVQVSGAHPVPVTSPGIDDPVTTDADLMQHYDPLDALQREQHAAREWVRPNTT